MSVVINFSWKVVMPIHKIIGFVLVNIIHGYLISLFMQSKTRYMYIY